MKREEVKDVADTMVKIQIKNKDELDALINKLDSQLTDAQKTIDEIGSFQLEVGIESLIHRAT